MKLKYMHTEGWNFIDINLYQTASVDCKFDVEHIIHPASDEDQGYENFADWNGVREFVEERFQFNNERYPSRLEHPATASAPGSALAWTAMERLLNLLV